MPTSMIGGHALRTIRKLQGDLFETGFFMADPSIQITFRRYNVLTEDWDELPAKKVLVRWRHDKKLIRVYGGLTTPLATSPTSLDGMFMAFDPFDVNTGDRFTLLGLEGKVGQVWPSRNGKRRASFTVEADTRPV